MANPSQKNVRLYYLGGLNRGGDTSRPIPVRSRGRVYLVPPVGGHLDLPQQAARDLINRHQVETKEGIFPVFTYNGSLAAAVKNGMKPIPVNKRPEDLSKAELQALMSRFTEDDPEPEPEPEPEAPPAMPPGAGDFGDDDDDDLEFLSAMSSPETSDEESPEDSKPTSSKSSSKRSTSKSSSSSNTK